MSFAEDLFKEVGLKPVANMWFAFMFATVRNRLPRSGAQAQ